MPKNKQSNADVQIVAAWLSERRPEMVASLREMVLRESPTHSKKDCDALCAHLAGEFASLGGEVKIHRQRTAGDHLQINFAGPRGPKPILLLGHFDTVYDLGTLEKMPWRESKGRLYGPGVFDMKSGIVQMMFALWSLREAMGGVPRPVKVLLVSDEEEGSATSRAITEKVAKQCAAVLVCEPSGPGGAARERTSGIAGSAAEALTLVVAAGSPAGPGAGWPGLVLAGVITHGGTRSHRGAWSGRTARSHGDARSGGPTWSRDPTRTGIEALGRSTGPSLGVSYRRIAPARRGSRIGSPARPPLRQPVRLAERLVLAGRTIGRPRLGRGTPGRKRRADPRHGCRRMIGG